jgi:hypothetical protein
MKCTTFLAFQLQPWSYHQRTQRDRLEEMPHSRLDIRGPRTLTTNDQDGGSGRLPFRLDPPSDRVPRRERNPTTPIYRKVGLKACRRREAAVQDHHDSDSTSRAAVLRHCRTFPTRWCMVPSIPG